MFGGFIQLRFGEASEDLLFTSTLQIAQPVWRARQAPQGVTFAFLRDYIGAGCWGLSPARAHQPVSWDHQESKQEPVSSEARRGKSGFSHQYKNNSNSEGKKIQVNRHGVRDKRDPRDVCSSTTRSITLPPKGISFPGTVGFHSFTAPGGTWSLSREIK